MRIGVFQDIHANLPAFEKAMEVFNKNGCEKIYHLGDLIGIGPFPKEVFDLATAEPKLTLLMGNHDYWYAYPNEVPEWMGENEKEHHRWTHNQIGEENRTIVQSWKFIENLKAGSYKTVCLMHYAYNTGAGWFKDFIKTPSVEALDKLFIEVDSDIIFYGHNHNASEITGKKRYINLGSSGCNNKAEVRLGIIDIEGDMIKIEKLSVKYDDKGLMKAFENRKVPDREFITKNFITRK